MNFGNEKRSSVRHPYKGGITFCLFNHRNSMEAESVDVCADGLKFRTLDLGKDDFCFTAV